MRPIILVLSIALVLSGCVSGSRQPGGYFEDDGPHKEIPVDIAGIPDAVPRWEPVDPSRSRAYIVLGHKYYPLTDASNYRETGVASWYGRKFHGRRTALGETYDMYQMTAAHKTLPLPSYVQVRNLANNKTVVVRVNDRGPFLHKRLIDLSYAAAYKLDMLKTGTANVEVVALTPGKQPAPPADVVQVAPVKAVAAEEIQAEPLPASSAATGTVALTTPTVANTAIGKDKTIYIQVGAFGAAQNAEKLRTRLEQADFKPVLVVPFQKADQQLYRVRIGPLDSVEQGQTVSNQLTDIGISGSHIVSE
jgi:rare lipoprotein A